MTSPCSFSAVLSFFQRAVRFFFMWLRDGMARSCASPNKPPYRCATSSACEALRYRVTQASGEHLVVKTGCVITSS